MSSDAEKIVNAESLKTTRSMHNSTPLDIETKENGQEGLAVGSDWECVGTENPNERLGERN